MTLESQELPKDLSDLESIEICDWWTQFAEARSDDAGIMDFNKEKDLVYQALISRASEIDCGTIETIIGDEIVKAPFGLGLIMDIVPKLEDTFSQLEILQVGMSTLPQWPEMNSDGFHTEFLELMWRTLDLVDTKISDPSDADTYLGRFLELDKFWLNPIVLSSIVALKSPNTKSLERLFKMFLEIWDFDSQALKEDNKMDIMNHDLESVAPLLAVSALSPNAPMKLVQKVLEITTWPDCEEFGISFWEYVCALISRGDEDCFWAPQVAWRDGFFVNGLWSYPIHISSKSEIECLLYYFANRDELNFENIWGEQLTQRHVLELLSKHPAAEKEFVKAADQVLADLSD